MAYLLKGACCCCRRRDSAVYYTRNNQDGDIGTVNQAYLDRAINGQAFHSPFNTPTYDNNDVREARVISPTRAHAEILRNHRPVLRDIVDTARLWPYLRKYEVVTRATENKIKLNTTPEEQVDLLLDHIETKPPWCFHALLRSCGLSDQGEVIELLGFPSGLYECAEDTAAKPWSRNREQQSRGVDPTEPTSSIHSPSQKEFSNRLMQVLAVHNEYYKDNLMLGRVFDFKHNDPEADIYDVDVCYVQQDIEFHQYKKTVDEIKLRDILRKHGPYSMPRTTLLYGPAGAGKSTFIRRFAYRCAQEYLKFIKEPTQHTSPEPALVIYVPARTMTSDIWGSIERELRCKEEDKPFLMTEVRSGQLSTDNASSIAMDAIDEVRDPEVLKAIQDFIKQKHQEGGPQILVSARTGLSRIDKSVFNRFLHLEGFTLQQGLEYTHKYITQHSQREHNECPGQMSSTSSPNQQVDPEPPILSHIQNKQEELRPILTNPLRAHLLSGLAVEGLVELDDGNVLQSVDILTTMERFFIQRETGGIGVPAEESMKFYCLCLFGLLEGLREFRDDHLQKFNVTGSTYLSFLRRDSRRDKLANHVTFYSFEHELLYEFFGARAIETLAERTRKAILLYVNSKDILRNLQKLMFGILGDYGGEDSVPLLVGMTRLLLLQKALEKEEDKSGELIEPQYPVCQKWYFFEANVQTLQQLISETLPAPGLILSQLDNENMVDGEAVQKIWDMVTTTFTQLIDLIKSNQSPYGEDYWTQKYFREKNDYDGGGFVSEAIMDLLADCTLRQQTEVARHTYHRMLPCNGYYPCGNTRWKWVNRWNIDCLSPEDLLEHILQYMKDITDRVTTDNLHIFFSKTSPQQRHATDDHWTRDVWDRALHAVMSHYTILSTLSIHLPDGYSSPLKNLLHSIADLDTSDYPGGGIVIRHGTISLSELHQWYQESHTTHNMVSLEAPTLHLPAETKTREELLQWAGEEFLQKVKNLIAVWGLTVSYAGGGYPLPGDLILLRPLIVYM